jgi:hypothetical protein
MVLLVYWYCSILDVETRYMQGMLLGSEVLVQ